VVRCGVLLQQQVIEELDEDKYLVVLSIYTSHNDQHLYFGSRSDCRHDIWEVEATKI
jgi:hypothetical protein